MTAYELTALVLWLGLLVFAFWYTRKVRHPKIAPLAAFLIFMIAFSVVAALLFSLATFLVTVAGAADALRSVWWALPLLLLVFAPAFWIGTRLIRRKPAKTTPPD